MRNNQFLIGVWLPLIGNGSSLIRVKLSPMRNNQFLIGVWLPLIRNGSFLFRVRLSPMRNGQFLIGFWLPLIRNGSFLFRFWLSQMRNSRFLIRVWLPESEKAGLSGGPPKGQRNGFRRPGGPLTPKKVAQTAAFYQRLWRTGCIYRPLSDYRSSTWTTSARIGPIAKRSTSFMVPALIT